MDTTKNKMKEILKEFYFAARASICHCFDHSNGMFPDDCDCNARQRTMEAFDAMNDAYKEAIDKLNDIKV